MGEWLWEKYLNRMRESHMYRSEVTIQRLAKCCKNKVYSMCLCNSYKLAVYL